MVDIFRGKNVLVTGGSGSIGSEIVKKLLQYGPQVVRVLSNDENCLFNLEQELKGHSNLRFLVDHDISIIWAGSGLVGRSRI